MPTEQISTVFEFLQATLRNNVTVSETHFRLVIRLKSKGYETQSFIIVISLVRTVGQLFISITENN